MTTMQWFDSIEKVLAEAKKEDTRLKAGIKCAAPKLRKHLRELATLSKAGRQEALDRGKAIPKKVPKRTASAKTPKAADTPATGPELGPDKA